MMTLEDEWAKLNEWTRDSAAAALLMSLGQFSQKLDDVVDEEMLQTERSASLVEAFCDLLGTVVANPYWQANASWLIPMTIRAFMEWDLSNRCQRSSSKSDHVHGFVRREAMDGLIVSVVTHIHGASRGREVAWEVQQFYHVENLDGESVETWVKEAANG